MSTDETRPQGATNEPGGPADAGPAGPDPADPAAGPAPTPPGQQPYPETGFFASIRRGLFPRADQRWVGGVAGGVADRIGWDPLLVRGILIITFFLGGIGLILYGIGWALLPERDGRIHLQEAFRGNFDVAMLGAVAVFLTGFAWGGGSLDSMGGFEHQVLSFSVWIVVVGGLVYLLVRGVQRQRDQNAARRQGLAPGPRGQVPTPQAPSAQPFTPAPPVEYRRPDGLVYATGAGPAPRQQQPQPHPQQHYQQGPVPGGPPLPAYTPPTRTSRGPGGAAVGIVIGIALLLGALLMIAHRTDQLPQLDSPVGYLGAWAGLSTVALGVAILVSALRGRSSGLLGFFAILALLVGIPYMAFAGPATDYWLDETTTSTQRVEELMTGPHDENAMSITEGTVAVETIREAEKGFFVRWGEPTIDLSELDLSRVDAGDPVVVPIQLGAGRTEVIVPKDVAVDASTEVAAGNILWDVDNQQHSTSGVGSSDYFASDEVGDDGAVLTLQIEAGAGEVVISETNSRSES